MKYSCHLHQLQNIIKSDNQDAVKSMCNGCMIRAYSNLTNATDSNEIAGSHEQHAINFAEARSDVRQKKSSFANDFDRWTRKNSEEQQQDDSNTGKSAKNERQATDRDEQDEGLSL